MATLERTIALDVLAGEPITLEMITDLRKTRSVEGLHHDFKSGTVLTASDKKGRDRLRKTAASFANSDGGLLIIGVGEPPVDKAPRPLEPIHLSSEAAENRVQETLRTLRALLTTPLRFASVELDDGGTVVLVAISRSDVLVEASNKHGERIFPFRVGDGDIEAPEYLISDLRLGRRARPDFDVVVRSVKLGLQARKNGSITFQGSVNNTSLQWIDEAHAFVVVPSMAGHAGLSQPLSQRVELLPTFRERRVTFDQQRKTLVDARTTDRGMPLAEAPFKFDVVFPGEFWATRTQAHPDAKGNLCTWRPGTGLEWNAGNAYRSSDDRGQVEILVPIWVVARGAPPRGFQVTITIGLGADIGDVRVERAEGPPRAGFEVG